MVVVPDDQLSLAIGREGQNVRLAHKLTNWKIDIKSVSQMEQAEREAQMQQEQDYNENYEAQQNAQYENEEVIEEDVFDNAEINEEIQEEMNQTGVDEEDFVNESEESAE